MTTLFQADPVFLMSIAKPLLFAVLLVAWAWAASHIDKDAEYFYLPRTYTNLALIACGLLAFALVLLIPIFWVGYPLAILILIGSLFGYAYYRNTKVPKDKKWTLSLDTFREQMQAKSDQRALDRATVTMRGPDGGSVPMPVGEDPNAAAHMALENALEFALPRNANEINLEVDGKQAVMVARIDGVKYPMEPIEPQTAMQLMDYLKGIGRLNLEERRKRQTATIGFDQAETGQHELEISTGGSTRSLWMTMEIDKTERGNLPITELGLLDSQLEKVKQLTQQVGKVVLVAAPPGNGTTTTLYSLIQEHDPYVSGIITVEEVMAFEVEGVNHNICGESMGAQQVNEKLGAIIRSDPQVVMVSKLRDKEMGRLIAKSAEEIRFYVAIPAEDAMTALKMWIKLIGDPKSATKYLGGVIAQRLVRKLCVTCRLSYRPDPERLKKMNLPADKVSQLFAASGKVTIKDKEQPCPTCAAIGYRGRTPVFEVMVFDDKARSLAGQGELDAARSHLRKQKTMLMNEAALSKVVQGETDTKEVARVFSKAKSTGRSSSSSRSKQKEGAAK